MTKLSLPTVTLCAVTSVNLPATVVAFRACLDQIHFGDAILFTDKADVDLPSAVRRIPIAPLKTAADYSRFILRELVADIDTDHVLIIQWDGFVLDADRWQSVFLNVDYIGAPWPQFADAADVGNGGFSLRSRALLKACLDPDFIVSHPEDAAVCRNNRTLLEQKHGLRFADRRLAGHFAYERMRPDMPTFGFHGVFNMVPELGADKFWQLYRTLDHPETAFLDWRTLVRQLAGGPNAWARGFKLTIDLIRAKFDRPVEV